MEKRFHDINLRIVVPLCNEEELIELFYARTRKVVQKYNYSFRFVDDGSTDNTLAKIQTLSILDGRISYISFSRNFGQQNALKAGYDHSSAFDCVVSMDAVLCTCGKHSNRLEWKVDHLPDWYRSNRGNWVWIRRRRIWIM